MDIETDAGDINAADLDIGPVTNGRGRPRRSRSGRSPSWARPRRWRDRCGGDPARPRHLVSPAAQAALQPALVVFGPVWTTLYGLMSWSAYRIWKRPDSPERTRALQISARSSRSMACGRRCSSASTRRAWRCSTWWEWRRHRQLYQDRGQARPARRRADGPLPRVGQLRRRAQRRHCLSQPPPEAGCAATRPERGRAAHAWGAVRTGRRSSQRSGARRSRGWRGARRSCGR